MTETNYVLTNQVIKGDLTIKVNGKDNVVSDNVIDGVLDFRMNESIKTMSCENCVIGKEGLIVNADIKILTVTNTTTPFIKCNAPDCELHIDTFSHKNTKITGFKLIRMI